MFGTPPKKTRKASDLSEIAKVLIDFIYDKKDGCGIVPANIIHESKEDVSSRSEKDLEADTKTLDIARKELEKKFDSLSKENKLNIDLIIEMTNTKTLEIKQGNCHELSYLFFDLAKQYFPTTSLELMFAEEHMFIVINRKLDSNENDPTSWGDNCIIADPWKKMVMDTITFQKHRVGKGGDPDYTLAVSSDINRLHGEYPDLQSTHRSMRGKKTI
ncbi:MAG: hypothetical protein ABI597_03160 [Gammaproteobacteria bacterium]